MTWLLQSSETNRASARSRLTLTDPQTVPVHSATKRRRPASRPRGAGSRGLKLEAQVPGSARSLVAETQPRGSEWLPRRTCPRGGAPARRAQAASGSRALAPSFLRPSLTAFTCLGRGPGRGGGRREPSRGRGRSGSPGASSEHHGGPESWRRPPHGRRWRCAERNR